MKYNFLHQPFYCEENIWQLAKQRNEDKAEVWFIINKNKTVAMAQQQAADTGSFVLWDYHVVYFSPQEGVLDLDTRCAFPCSLEHYLTESFLSITSIVTEEYLPYFRVIPASEYLALFSSNRNHMLDEKGQYLQPPPEWAAIGKGSNLEVLVDFKNTSIGEIASLRKMLGRSTLD